jgi:NAD(P)-dependent dehydrogenase (short-subunit alcohol dehydrogenase family)
MDIKGKNALITGSANGIGRATAIALAEKGARHIHLVDIDATGLSESAALVVALGAQATIHTCDVGDMAALAAVFDASADATPLDIVFNNAGIVTGADLFPNAPVERMQRLFHINFHAVVYGTQLAVQKMGERGGVVVNMGSQAALHPRYRDILYSASKGAVDHFTHCCFPLMESHGVRVCGLNPSLVDTAIVQATGGDRVADWMIPALENNVAMPPSKIGNAVVDLIEDDGNAGVTIEILTTAKLPEALAT